MYQLEIDTARNILRLTFSKLVDETQAQSYCQRVEAALAHLQPGFRLLTDLTDLVEMDYDCAPEIRAVMDLCQTKGVAAVVRVIPDPKKDIGFKVMSYFHYGQEVPIVTVETLMEAEEKLAAN